MLAAIVLVGAAAQTWRPASTSRVKEFVCREDARHFDIEAGYDARSSFRVRVANSTFTGQCDVNVSLENSLERSQNELPPLLLVKVERLRLNSTTDSFHASMPNDKLRTENYCVTAHCNSTYLWASQKVQLLLFVGNSLQTPASNEAEIIVAEATNVCGLANRSGDLTVQNSDRKAYAFASEPRHSQIPPNNETCTGVFNYSLTIRPSVASASLVVSVLACPANKRCATLLVDGRSCSDGAMVSSALPGSPITLHYELRCDGRNQFVGFVVSAEANAFVESPSVTVKISSRATSASMASTNATRRPTTSVAGNARSSSSMRTFSTAIGSRSIETGATVVRAADATMPPRKPSMTRQSISDAAITSSSANATAVRGHVENPAEIDVSATPVAASVATVAATAVVIGIAVALICRRRRRLRAARQKPQERTFLNSRSEAAASAEEIAMLENDLYGIALASTTTAQQ